MALLGTGKLKCEEQEAFGMGAADSAPRGEQSYGARQEVVI